MASCGLCQKGQRELLVAQNTSIKMRDPGNEVVNTCDVPMVWLLLFTGHLSSYEKAVQLEVSDTFTGTDAPL